MLLTTRQIVGNPRTHKQGQSALGAISSYLCLPHKSELFTSTGHDIFLANADKLNKYRLAKGLHTGKYFFWKQFSRMTLGTVLMVTCAAAAYWWVTRIRDDYHLVTVTEEITRFKREMLYDTNGYYYFGGEPVAEKYSVRGEEMQSYSDSWTVAKNTARFVLAVPFVFVALAQVGSMYYELKGLYGKLRTRFARVPKNVEAISTDDERYKAVLSCVDAAGVSHKEANRLHRELADKDPFEIADKAPITSDELLAEFMEQISVGGPTYDATINALSEVGHVIAKRDAKIDGSSEYVLEQKTRDQLTQALPGVANTHLGGVVSTLAQSIRDERVEQAKEQFVESAVRTSVQNGAELSKSVLRSNAQSEAELILASVRAPSVVK